MYHRARKPLRINCFTVHKILQVAREFRQYDVFHVPECDATRFDTCTLHLSDHIRQVPQQYAASADDVIQDTTTYASITVSEIEVNRMPNQLRNLLNLDKVTLKVKTNQTPTGTKTPSTEAVTTLKDVLSAMYQWHNIDELFTHLLQESPRVLGFHDLICQ